MNKTEIETEKQEIYRIRSKHLNISYYVLTDEIVWAFDKIPYSELKNIVEKIESIKNTL